MRLVGSESCKTMREDIVEENASRGSALGGTEVVPLVEDEQAPREIVATILTGEGYRLLAADGAEALKMLEQHAKSISLVVTDFCIPVCDGATV